MQYSVTLGYTATPSSWSPPILAMQTEVNRKPGYTKMRSGQDVDIQMACHNFLLDDVSQN
jgi:hypothetical protein